MMDLNKTERQILKFLEKRGGFTPLISIKRHFFPNDANEFFKVLRNMKQKGLIEIRAEINPDTGKSKQRVYLKQ